jgi:pimeloyl-ACP methyl ester carboxylesterase
MSSLPGFTAHRIELAEGHAVAALLGGAGPPVLLHGWPQTHAAWHRIAPSLARDFTVVATDLRGYGDSTGPLDGSKRAMVADYRAAAAVDEAQDLADEAAGRRLACPVQVLWEAERWSARETPRDIWERWCVAPVVAAAIADGHLMAETSPDAVLAAAQPFLREHAA